MKRLVKDLIRQKGLHNFTRVTRDTSIFEALNILNSQNCSALLVVENNKLLGIFSEKDFARASLTARVRLSAPVSTIMTSKVYYTLPSFNLEDCLKVMSKVHVRHLPVLENETPIALVSMRDIMEVLIDDKETQIQELMSYIAGGRPTDIASMHAKQTNTPIYFTNQNQEIL